MRLKITVNISIEYYFDCKLWKSEIKKILRDFGGVTLPYKFSLGLENVFLKG